MTLLNPLLQFASRFQSKEIHTTYFSFKLVTRVSVNILFLCIVAMFSCAFLLNNNVIECYTDNKQIVKLATTRCWAEGVFIDRYYLTNGTMGKNVIAPGVGIKRVDDADDIIHQSYYQWIGPLLIMQGFIFYLPRGLWKLFEGGVMGKLLGNSDGPIINESWKDKRKQLVDYMTNVRKKYHRTYFLKYFFCEILSLGAILFNMLLMKWVINDFWHSYQPAISALLSGKYDAFRRMSAVLFPFQAKCTYHTFGHSATIQDHDVLCYMPLNVINEKIFIFLYFWYIAIFSVAALNLVYLLSMLVFNSCRIMDIGRMVERTSTRRECRKISEKGDFGLWFTLKVLHRNLSPVLYQDLVKALNDAAPELPRPNSSKYSSDSDEEKEKY